MLMLKTRLSIKKGCVKGDFRESKDFLLIGVVFLLFPGIITTLGLSGVINAHAQDTSFNKKRLR